MLSNTILAQKRSAASSSSVSHARNDNLSNLYSRLNRPKRTSLTRQLPPPTFVNFCLSKFLSPVATPLLGWSFLLRLWSYLCSNRDHSKMAQRMHGELSFKAKKSIENFLISFGLLFLQLYSVATLPFCWAQWRYDWVLQKRFNLHNWQVIEAKYSGNLSHAAFKTNSSSQRISEQYV